MNGHAARSIVAALGATLILGYASPAMAAGMNLSWNDCGAAGSTNRNFACNTNTVNHDMFLSFDPPFALTAVTGNSQLLSLESASPTLSAWWQFKNAGSCRSTSLTALTESGTCLDPWQGQGVASIAAYLVTANTPSLAPNRARIIGSIALPASVFATVEPGTEYLSMVIRINSAKTVGTGVCAGCLDPVCIILNELIVTQPPGTPNEVVTLNNPLYSHYVTWQGGAINTFGCPGGSPTVNRTWGRVKGIYR